MSDVRYELYGLMAGNPYTTRPLNSLEQELDRSLLLELEGFVRLPKLQEAIEAAVTRRGPALFLITGVGMSGRTSLANHLLYLYHQAHGPQHRLATHRMDGYDMTHDAYAQVRSTLLSLRNKMGLMTIEMPPGLRGRFSELSRRGSVDPMDEYDLQEIAEFLAATFAASDAAFGVVYEGVATKDLITLSTRVFENTPAVVVFTVDAYQHANAAQLTEADRSDFARRGTIIDLPLLTTRQIACLAEQRWTGTPPVPFDPDDLQAVFDSRRFTIGQALRHLEVLLDLRLVEYEGEDLWPTDDLRMSSRWLRIKMWQGERWSRLR
ncbi:hypothetical protein ACFQQB_11420 [Nonomuraea rubra]|uniref:hypothetical protein n=1 Tax=Nonomuraea rubra TaxID=46180 RepID=UPI00361FE49B